MPLKRVISYSERFEDELFEAYCFIAKDSADRADAFVAQLRSRIEMLPEMPYGCRQSLKSYSSEVRDLVFKGYVIPYRIRQESLEIVGMFNQNEWELHPAG